MIAAQVIGVMLVFLVMVRLVLLMARQRDGSSVCLVTAFKELGRGDWPGMFRRSTAEYLSRFKRLIGVRLPMVVYLFDRAVFERVQEMVRDRKEWTKVVLVEDPGKFRVFSEFLPAERTIMASAEYQSWIAHRRDHPENCVPEYNCVMHAKVELVRDAILHRYHDAVRWLWVDFGYCLHPENMLPAGGVFHPLLEACNDRFNVMTISDVIPSDRDALGILKAGTVRMIGPFWMARGRTWLEMYELYGATVRKMHNQGIADDDQSVLIQAYFQQPSLFKFWRNDLSHPSNWFRGFHLMGNQEPVETHVGKQDPVDFAGFTDRKDFAHGNDFADRKDFAKVWKGMSGGVFVEVGVWEGAFTNFVLEHSAFGHVYGVDPYKQFGGDEFKDALNAIGQSRFDQVHRATVERFAKYPRFQLLRTTSEEAVAHFQDGTVDFVYIDGNHGYRHALKDMELWWPKVKRRGGILAGDDCVDDLAKPYDSENNQRIDWTGDGTCWGYYGVNRALRDFEHKFSVTAVRLAKHQWMVRKMR